MPLRRNLRCNGDPAIVMCTQVAMTVACQLANLRSQRVCKLRGWSHRNLRCVGDPALALGDRAAAHYMHYICYIRYIHYILYIHCIHDTHLYTLHTLRRLCTIYARCALNIYIHIDYVHYLRYGHDIHNKYYLQAMYYVTM